MYVDVNGRQIETDEQGFLLNLDDWSEEFVEKAAEQDGLTLYDESWGLIGYFREYYQQNSSHPSMRQLVLNLGRQSGEHFHDRKRTRSLSTNVPARPHPRAVQARRLAEAGTGGLTVCPS